MTPVDKPGPLRILPLLFVLGLLGLVVFRTPATVAPIAGQTMGTTYEVLFGDGVSLSTTRRAALAKAIDAVLVELNAQMSTYDPTSELSRFNALQSTEPQALAAPTVAVCRLAAEVSAATGGAFDVTVGPLVKAFGFGPGGERTAPTDAELVALKARVGYRMLTLGADGRVTKGHPAMEVDLSAIAKGHGVDRVAELLVSEGIGSYFVEIGGEVRVAGQRPGGGAWRIGIERPPAPGGAGPVQRVVRQAACAVATSGDYRKYREVAGKRLSHLIDPRTCRPIEHTLAAASVIDASCARADAWATALMVLGPTEGLAVARARGIAALLQIRTPDGFRVVSTPAWDRLELSAEGRP